MASGTQTPIDTDDATVLVVDDESDVAELYTAWLSRTYDVRTANDGDEALEKADDDVDVIFLDRQMPGKSGDEVLDILDERGLDCRVVMVTAVDPDFDIVEMPFDDYLTKPVSREELSSTVDEMQTRDSYDDQLQEYFSLASKKATLEAEKHPSELEGNDEYQAISQQVEDLHASATETVTEVDNYEAVFSEFPGGD